MQREVADNGVATHGGEQLDLGVTVFVAVSMGQLLALMVWGSQVTVFRLPPKARIGTSSIICEIWHRRKIPGPLLKYH